MDAERGTMTHPELPAPGEVTRLAKQVRDILRDDGNAALWLHRVSGTEPVKMMVLGDGKPAPFPFVCVHKWWWPSDARESVRSIRAVVCRVAGRAVRG